MLKNIEHGGWKTEVWYELVFDDGCNNGFGFPCDAYGNVPEDLNEGAKKNLAYCLSHPEKFSRFKKVVRYEQDYRCLSHGTCACGEEVYLQNEYAGACECPKCGRWYNLFGQELNPPSMWNDAW